MNQLIELFEYQFFVNALIGTLLASIIAGFIGTYIVSRKIVFISDGITHASFGGIGIAYFFGFNPFMGALLFGIVTAFGIEWAQKKTNIREDSAIAVLWSVGMAIGIIFVFLTPGYTPNLMSFLFGNILSITSFDLIIMGGLTLFITSLFLIFYRPILYSAFDPEFAKALGLPVSLIRYILMISIAITVVVCIKIAGIILVMSLFTIPHIIANIYTKEFKTIIWLSMIFAFLGVIGGLIISYYADLPSGATIIIILVALWGILKGVSKFV
ncbi:MAG: metal ABC transporter permease [Marinilabiliaceae bacterium]|nr:metal ABC transporter permease [Marinilabiliaceae bacterium]